MPADISTLVNRPYVSSATQLSVQLDVVPPETEPTASRHIAICVDTSRSMESDDKLENAKAAITDWVFGLLDDDDHISIVAFDSDPHLVLPLSRWGDIDREAAEQKVTELSAGNNTDMYGGLEAAAETLPSPAADSVPKRIVLLSDGKQNSPEKPVGSFETLARDIDEAGIRIRAGGIGADYREETIRALGTTARGQWIHVEQSRDINRFFQTAVEDAGTVVETDMALRLTPTTGVELSDIHRANPQVQEADVQWRNGTGLVKLPDLRERESQTVTMEVQAPDGPTDDDTERSLADVELLSGEETVATDSIDVTYTEDNDLLAKRNEDVEVVLRKTIIRSELGKGNVSRAETLLEESKVVHDDTRLRDVERETTVVKENDGDVAERNDVTRVHDED